MAWRCAVVACAATAPSWGAAQAPRFEVVVAPAAHAGPLAEQLPPGEYWAQPVINVYEQVTRADGYPRPLWDKLTGTIDREVATYMREHGFDLREYAQRNWPTLGPKLAGKLHFFAGDMDDFYLNRAVYQFEQLAQGTTDPRSDATFTYGRPTKGHSWHAWTWAEFVRRFAADVRGKAPAGESTAWWAR